MECSRDIKLKTLDALPDLIAELLKKVMEQVADVHEKVSSLENLFPPESTNKPVEGGD